jgi:hypothetical protein
MKRIADSRIAVDEAHRLVPNAAFGMDTVIARAMQLHGGGGSDDAQREQITTLELCRYRPRMADVH